MAEKTLMEKLRGKRLNDIELPNESGKDPRLEKPDVGGAFRKAGENLKKYKPKSESLKGLYDAAGIGKD